MLNNPTIEMIDHLRQKEALEAHNRLEELRKPDELNERIMTMVNLIVEKFSGQSDAAELRSDIETLIELIQRRKSKSESGARRSNEGDAPDKDSVSTIGRALSSASKHRKGDLPQEPLAPASPPSAGCGLPE